MLFSHSTVIYCVGLRNSPSAPRFWSVDPGRRSPGSVHELKIPQRGGHVFLHFLAATVHIYVHENVSKYIYIIYIYIYISLSQGHVHLNIPCWLLPHPQVWKSGSSKSHVSQKRAVRRKAARFVLVGRPQFRAQTLQVSAGSDGVTKEQHGKSAANAWDAFKFKHGGQSQSLTKITHKAS